MEGLKTCSNGHFYEEKLNACPHCPTNENSKNENERTIVFNKDKSTGNPPTENTEILKTKVFGDSTIDPINNSGKLQTGGNTATPDFTKTRVTGAQEDEKSSSSVATRKVLKGWIVTYDIDKYGVDFKIFEGRNTIGKGPEHTITVMDDEVSSLHAVLLYRTGKFYITDELSTNGVKVNDKELLPRDPCELNDGDKISLGSKVTFLFRIAF